MKTNIKETLAFKELTPEEKEKRGILGRLYGPCADFINPTRNGRTYSDELWEKVFNENELVKEAFENGGIPGELDHPTDREEIDSSKIAIMMPEPPKKDKDGHLIAYFDILDTPNGRIAYQLAKYGYKLGISSRGSGDVDDMDDSVIPESYEFKCFDLVLTPSVKDARLTMTEALQTQKTNEMKRALHESLDKADPDEKKVMEETLDRLNITLEEDKEEREIPSEETETIEVPAESEESVESTEEIVDAEPESTESEEAQEESEPAESAELSFEDKIKELYSLMYKGDDSPKEEDIEAFIQAFKSIFPEECFSHEDGCADKELEVETSEETIDDTEEAEDSGSDELINSLQDALTAKTNLESELKSLQEQLAVSDAKAKTFNEELNRYKSSIVTLSEAARDVKKYKAEINSLEEKLQEKESKITQLIESKKNENSLNESLSSKDSQIASLNESIKSQKESYESEIKKLKESLEADQRKFEKQSQMIESYRKKAESAANSYASRYIETRANMLGRSAYEITSRLPEKYDLDDVDRICEDLQDSSYSMNNLPYTLKNVKKVQMVESKNDHLKIDTGVDDNVDDSLLELAKL